MNVKNSSRSTISKAIKSREYKYNMFATAVQDMERTLSRQSFMRFKRNVSPFTSRFPSFSFPLLHIVWHNTIHYPREGTLFNDSSNNHHLNLQMHSISPERQTLVHHLCKHFACSGCVHIISYWISVPLVVWLAQNRNFRRSNPCFHRTPTHVFLSFGCLSLEQAL